MGFFERLFGKKEPGQSVKQEDKPSGQDNPQKNEVKIPRYTEKPLEVL